MPGSSERTALVGPPKVQRRKHVIRVVQLVVRKHDTVHTRPEPPVHSGPTTSTRAMHGSHNLTDSASVGMSTVTLLYLRPKWSAKTGNKSGPGSRRNVTDVWPRDAPRRSRHLGPHRQKRATAIPRQPSSTDSQDAFQFRQTQGREAPLPVPHCTRHATVGTTSPVIEAHASDHRLRIRYPKR